MKGWRIDFRVAAKAFGDAVEKYSFRYSNKHSSVEYFTVWCVLYIYIYLRQLMVV